MFLPKPERNGLWVLRRAARPTSRVGSVSKFVREAGFVIGCLPVKVGHIR